MNEGERRLCDYQYERLGGFYTSLFEAISRADYINLAKLKLGFPEEVVAFMKFNSEPGYWEVLEEEYLGFKD